MSLFLEKRSIKCESCGAPFKYYWDGQYWCVECGSQHSLVKLIVQQQQELAAVWDILKRIQKKIGDVI